MSDQRCVRVKYKKSVERRSDPDRHGSLGGSGK